MNPPQPQHERELIYPSNDDAEDEVLGAVLLSPKAARRAFEELDGREFYRDSNRTIFLAARAVELTGAPPEPLLVIEELRRTGKLEAAGGELRLRELAAIVPTAANVPHYCELVRDAHRRRELMRGLMGGVDRLVNGATAQDALSYAEDALDWLRGSMSSPQAEPPRTLASVLEQDPPEQVELVEGIVEAGAPGAIVGQPEVGKGWLALELAWKVAAGGKFLDRYPVTKPGPVLYWWEDTSEAQAITRVKLFAKENAIPAETRVHFHVVRRAQFPHALAILEHEIEQHGYVLVILDSLYNFAPAGFALKDEDAATMILDAKQVCDRTGCAIVFVDHAPWPTDLSQALKRPRAYGSVFKGAALRWAMYLEPHKQAGEAWFTVRGNNVAGVPRTLALLDRARHVWRLHDEPADETPAEEKWQRALELLEAGGPPASSTKLVDAIGGRKRDALRLLDAWEEEGLIHHDRIGRTHVWTLGPRPEITLDDAIGPPAGSRSVPDDEELWNET